MSSNCGNHQCKDCNKKPFKMYPSVDATVEDLNLISSIFLIVSKDCNMRCKYCFVEQEPANMTYDTALDAVEFIYKNSQKNGRIPSLTYFGGEPMIRWDDIVKPLTEYIRNRFGNEFELSITTNGYLLDEEKLKFFKENNVGLLLSMDGGEKTQNLNRPLKGGQGSFEKLDALLPIILKYYPNVTFRSTTDFDNVDEFVLNHKYAVEKGFTSVFNIVNVFSEWSMEAREKLRYAVDELGDYYLDLVMAGKNVSFGPFREMFGKLDRIDHANKNDEYRTAGEGILACGRCGLGATVFASVGTDGTLYSCQEMVGNKSHGEHFSIGSIYDGVDDEKRLEISRRFDTKNVVNSEDPNKCKSCRMNNICDGACVINNYFVTGELTKMPDILCYYYNILLDKAENIRAKMNNLKNSGLL